MRDLARLGEEFSIGVKRSKEFRALIAQIPESDWVTIIEAVQRRCTDRRDS